MVARPLFVAGALVTTALAGTVGKRGEHGPFSCGSVFNQTQLDPAATKAILKRQAAEAPDDGQPIELNFIAHLCCSRGGECGTEDQVRQQVDETNKSYADAKISFKLQKVTQADCGRIDFSNLEAMEGLKERLHEGDKSTLNVVYINSPPEVSIKGVCNIIDARTGDLGKRDGCFVAMNTLPGFAGNGDGQDLSKVTTHELGHAMGLLHPFPEGGNNFGEFGAGVGGSCADGDGIPDTPAQGRPTQGCPSERGRRSLTSFVKRQFGFPGNEIDGPGGQGGPGVEAAGCQQGTNEHNIMDYSSCQQLSFTKGQIDHMRGVARFRRGLVESPPLLPAEGGGSGGGAPPGPNGPPGGPGGRPGPQGPPQGQPGGQPGGPGGRPSPGGPPGGQPGGPPGRPGPQGGDGPPGQGFPEDGFPGNDVSDEIPRPPGSGFPGGGFPGEPGGPTPEGFPDFPGGPQGQPGGGPPGQGFPGGPQGKASDPTGGSGGRPNFPEFPKFPDFPEFPGTGKGQSGAPGGPPPGIPDSGFPGGGWPGEPGGPTPEGFPEFPVGGPQGRPGGAPPGQPKPRGLDTVKRAEKPGNPVFTDVILHRKRDEKTAAKPAFTDVIMNKRDGNSSKSVFTDVITH